MRIASRPFARAGRSAQGYFLMMVGVLVLGWVAMGCDNKHIGRPCEVNADAGASGGSISIISSPVLQCPSRICLLPADMSVAAKNNDGPFCTDTCSSDDDCADAETGTKGDTSDTKCKSNFVCAVATTSGPFCCQKFCICHDFVNVPPGGFTTPTACMPGNTTCANVH
jgi:hypothetical protein